MTKIYIAGPMTGIPDLNYPAFHEAAAALRAAGHEVFNPAENPAPACGSWNGYMRMAIAQLTQCEAIYLLHGWSASKGARLEYRIAQDFQIKPIFQHNHRELGERDWRETFQELTGMWDRARLRAATSLQLLPPKAITACVMREDGGEQPAYCLMAAYRTEADAVEALGALAATQAEVQAEPVAWPHKEIGMVAIEWGRQKRLFPVLSKDGWMDKAIAELSAAYKAAAPQAKPAAVAVPDGWKLVPIEPQPEQLDSAIATDRDGTPASYKTLYIAMVGAALTPPIFAAQAEVQAESVAYVLGDPRYADSSNVFMSHQFTPDGEHEDEWTPLYTAPQAQPADALDAKALLTHRSPWRDAIVQMTTRGLTSDDDEQLYWRHELKAFDEAFAAMAAAQEGGAA